MKSTSPFQIGDLVEIIGPAAYFKQTVSLQEFDKGMANWKSMPGTMIRKCALVQALRECFATDLAGCYDSAEMDQSIEAEYEVGA